MEVGFEIKGGEALDELLKQLPRKVARQGAAKALRAAARVIRAEVQARAPKNTGLLRRSIKVRTRKFIAADERVVEVGYFGPAYRLAHLVENGTVPIRVPKGEKKLVFVINGKTFYRDKVKGMTAKPFFGPALDAAAGQALQTMGDVLSAEIEKYATNRLALLSGEGD